jgi:hypothetical protein
MRVRWERIALAGMLPVLLIAQGCSDDIVCGDTPPEVTPYISARVVESRDPGGDLTLVEVFCAADPLPDLLSAAVNDRAISHVGPDNHGLLATLEEPSIVWQAGTRCSLRVITEFGVATSGSYLPMPFPVSAPESIAVGDTLTVTWRASERADYYGVSMLLAAGTPNEKTITATVRDTFAVFLPSALSAAGELSGFVSAVSGPYPDGGSPGNISGAGWGFFTAAYRDSASAFRVMITEPAP